MLILSHSYDKSNYEKIIKQYCTMSKEAWRTAYSILWSCCLIVTKQQN